MGKKKAVFGIVLVILVLLLCVCGGVGYFVYDKYIKKEIGESIAENIIEGAIESEWLCLARLSFVPSIEKLMEVDQLFEEINAQYGGEYDGWETIVISE